MMKKTFLLLSVVLLCASTAQASSRGITVKLKASERAGAADAGSVKLYSNSYALVIGIDNYHAGWPRLGKAIADARAIAHVLRAKGFEVTLKTDLDSIALMQEFKKFFAIKGADPNARLLLWYAGHGHTINGEGYLVPADAPPAVSPAFKVSAIPMRDFGSLVRMANAKHVLSIFDSCFSGTVFQARAGAAPAAITRKTIKPVREFLTSGDAGQQVRDDGSFREYFIRALNGDERADVNGDGYVTGEELGLFMTQSMSALTNAAQTPKFGKLQDVHFNQGDYVFQLPAGAKRPVTSTTMPSSGSNQDSLFWSSIKDSNDSAMYKAYLNQFPHGTFAGLARLKAGMQLAMSGRPQHASYGPKYALTIQTSPGGARIRILNISPKYTSGMLLKSGRYHIEVSKSGYKLQRQWLVIGDEDIEMRIALKKKASGSVSWNKFVTIPSGSFQMGSNSGESNEKPVHRVHINSFKMGKYEVTQKQWKAVMGSNPSGFKGDRLPVERVSWDDIQQYIRKLNSQTGLHFRLPSDAEWEYAARAGSSTKYSWGDSIGSNRANCDGCGSQWDNSKTAPVGSFSPNSFGLYDMHGNVWEWVQDVYHANYNGAPSDGSAWEGSGGKRVLRGGSWYDNPHDMRSAYRYRYTADSRLNLIGLRLVQD